MISSSSSSRLEGRPLPCLCRSSRRSYKSRESCECNNTGFTMGIEIRLLIRPSTQHRQDNVKQLQGQAGQAMDSEAMKRARAVYEKARVSALSCLTVSIEGKERPC